MTELWHRQEYETAKQYEYFTHYCRLGITRSLEKVWQKYGKSKANIEKVSSKNNWVMRADAYDRFIDEIKRKENIEAIKKANIENIKIAQITKKVLGVKAQATLKKIMEAGDDPEAIEEATKDIPWGVVSSLLNMAVDTERKAYGINDEMLKVSLSGEISLKDAEISLNLKKAEILERLIGTDKDEAGGSDGVGEPTESQEQTDC